MSVYCCIWTGEPLVPVYGLVKLLYSPSIWTGESLVPDFWTFVPVFGPVNREWDEDQGM
jgi:hypothetical protein